jgi:DNA-binding NarL/FixJ family response regulator
VRNHISNIYKKLHIYDRTQAVLYAIREGLVDPNVMEGR